MKNEPISFVREEVGLFALAEERGRYNKCHTIPNANPAYNAVKIQLSASSRFVMPIR